MRRANEEYFQSCDELNDKKGKSELEKSGSLKNSFCWSSTAGKV